MAVNQRVGDCVVRTMKVTFFGAHFEHSCGENGAPGCVVRDYRITLDVENPTRRPARAAFVVEFSGGERKAVTTELLLPGAHREVTVELWVAASVGHPTSVFLRPAGE